MQLNEALSINENLLLEFKVSQINTRLERILDTQAVSGDEKKKQLTNMLTQLGLDSIERVKNQAVMWTQKDLDKLKSLTSNPLMQQVMENSPSIKAAMEYIQSAPKTAGTTAPAGSPAIRPAT